MRWSPVALALLVGACGLDPGSDPEAASVTIRGSDTMVILAQRWAEDHMAASPGAVMQVSGGGSGTGIAALITGTTDVATASRAIEASERALIRERWGVDVVEIPVAVDAIALYVHRDNPVTSLSLAELEAVYRGRLEDWAELGVEGLGPITLYSRENNSGTYAYFKAEVLRDFDFAAETQTLPGTAAVINAVSLDPQAIGYGGIGYAAGVRVVPLRLDPPGDAGTPAPIDATSLGYPLARPLLLYVVGEPSEPAQAFIDHVRSDAGQAAVVDLGFFPLSRLEAL